MNNSKKNILAFFSIMLLSLNSIWATNPSSTTNRRKYDRIKNADVDKTNPEVKRVHQDSSNEKQTIHYDQEILSDDEHGLAIKEFTMLEAEKNLLTSAQNFMTFSDQFLESNDPIDKDQANKEFETLITLDNYYRSLLSAYLTQFEHCAGFNVPCFIPTDRTDRAIEIAIKRYEEMHLCGNQLPPSSTNVQFVESGNTLQLISAAAQPANNALVNIFPKTIPPQPSSQLEHVNSLFDDIDQIFAKGEEIKRLAETCIDFLSQFLVLGYPAAFAHASTTLNELLLLAQEVEAQNSRLSHNFPLRISLERASKKASNAARIYRWAKRKMFLLRNLGHTLGDIERHSVLMGGHEAPVPQNYLNILSEEMAQANTIANSIIALAEKFTVLANQYMSSNDLQAYVKASKIFRELMETATKLAPLPQNLPLSISPYDPIEEKARNQILMAKELNTQIERHKLHLQTAAQHQANAFGLGQNPAAVAKFPIPTLESYESPIFEHKQEGPSTGFHAGRYASKTQLSSGTASVHEKIAFECKNCHKSFSTKSNLKIHLQTKHEKSAITCSYIACNESFSTKDNLERHINEVHREPLFKCKICNKVFLKNSSLKTHMQTAHCV